MAAKEEEVIKDCLGCRIVGAAGLIGIGGYLANYAWKNKTFAGKLTLSTLSLGFVNFGIARYKQTWPFNKSHKNDKNNNNINHDKNNIVKTS